MHTCPIPGHGGGPVATGVPSVIIGGQVSATVTSSCSVCGSLIATGSPTVIIGGNLAARLGDSTNHGGVVVQGCPTVLIGEAG
jgi:uncharacterized Zn-binding protein involved in type VI secretion